MRRDWIVCAGLGVLLLVPSPLFAQDEDDDDAYYRTITVVGEGEATSPPDMATIYTGVVTQAESPSGALEANNERMEELMQVLEDQDIASNDIQTSNFNVSPMYRHDPQGVRAPEIVGYQVSNTVQVRVRNLPDLGEVLDALVQGGSNQISGVSFDVDDPTGVMNQARNRAVSDARMRAELYAQAAGVEVGRVLSISEVPIEVPRPQMMEYARAAGMGGGAVPIATGEQEFRVQVHVMYELQGGGAAGGARRDQR